MNTKLVTAELRISHWAGIMKERSDSGLSVRAYCEREGFHENIYYYWQRKLREAACKQLSGEKGSYEETGLAQPVFAEVKVPVPVEQPLLIGSERQGEIRFVIDGVSFAADSYYPPEKIAALLKGLVQI